MDVKRPICTRQGCAMLECWCWPGITRIYDPSRSPAAQVFPPHGFQWCLRPGVAGLCARRWLQQGGAALCWTGWSACGSAPYRTWWRACSSWAWTPSAPPAPGAPPFLSVLLGCPPARCSRTFFLPFPQHLETNTQLQAQYTVEGTIWCTCLRRCRRVRPSACSLHNCIFFALAVSSTLNVASRS